MIIAIITTCAGLFIGFFSNYFIAKFNARNELKKSISEDRARFYIELWELCDRNIDSKEEQITRYEKLNKWYKKGGGLLLPFEATDRFIGALTLLKKSTTKTLSEEETKHIINNLSWLRTEMKYEVGSYTRKEANRILPNTK